MPVGVLRHDPFSSRPKRQPGLGDAHLSKVHSEKNSVTAPLEADTAYATTAKTSLFCLATAGTKVAVTRTFVAVNSGDSDSQIPYMMMNSRYSINVLSVAAT